MTDTPSFQGKLDYLEAARRATHLPALRKDFLFDPYQVFEARAYGADCILIIMACVTDAEAQGAQQDARMISRSTCWSKSMTKTSSPARCALEPRLIGINNRDLHTFETSSSKPCERLAEKIPARQDHRRRKRDRDA